MRWYTQPYSINKPATENSVEKKPRCERCEGSDQICSYDLKLTFADEAQARGIIIGRAGTSWKESKTRVEQRMTDFGIVAARSQVQSARAMSQHYLTIAFLNTTSEDIYMHRYHSSSIRYQQRLKEENAKGDKVDGGAKNVESDLIVGSEYIFDASAHAVEVVIAQPFPMSCSLKLSKSDLLLFEFCKYSRLKIKYKKTDHLLDVNRMCSTCTLLDGQDNGYRSFIIPISVDSPLLMKSVLAVAANHLHFQDPRYRIIALQYKGFTLKMLQRVFKQGPQIMSKSELLGTILMLCFFDISDGCHANWMMHLGGANTVMKIQSTIQDSRSDAAVSSFIGQYFASHNIMAYTALADPALEKTLFEGGLYWLDKINRPFQEIDCITGCSSEVMEIILKTSYRIRAQKKMPTSTDRKSIVPWKKKTERQLGCLLQNVPNSETAFLSSAASVVTVTKTAEVFRHATVILLQYLDPNATLKASTIQDCVRKILDIVRTCPIHPSGARSSSLWPFFIAACHVTLDEDRIFVLTRFYSLEGRKRFGNIRPVREVVEHVWKQRDLRGNTHGEKWGKRCFEWEETMELLGLNLSLT